ncbi:MAG TPA: diadenylate cyclase CdaA [Thermoanaerobaculia bacterium]
MTFYERLQSLQFGWRDAIDLAIVAIVVYQILRLIRGTRAMQMSIGLLLLGGGYFVSQALDLLALETLTRSILFYLPFAIIVLFQHEIRRALASFGGSRLAGIFARRQPLTDLEPIIRAVSELATRRIGALIVLERAESLRTWIEGGKLIDAVVSTELLLNIFTPNTPLHDGAVIIQGNRIAAANTFLPLSSNSELSTAHGTRHRAALGLTEETDALVIVVSEQNGSIAVAQEEQLYEALSPEALRHWLESRGVAFGRKAA